MPKTGITKEDLELYYLKKRMTTRRIGKILGVSKTTIRRHLLKHEIPIRDTTTAIKGDDYKRPTKEELEFLYIEKSMSFEQIAIKYNVDLSLVGLWLKKHGIKARRFGAAKKGKGQYSTKEFERRIFVLAGDEYTLLGEYVQSETKTLIRHNICGHEYMVRPHSFLDGRRCPYCNESHGEQTIRRYLKMNHFRFKKEYIIRGCKNERPLRFDFAVFNERKLLCLIEYDGKQHFQSVEQFGGQGTFEKIKRNDEIKNDFCARKNIPLIRIRFSIVDIEGKLEKELAKLHQPIQLALI